jgi:hypothetical protein
MTPLIRSPKDFGAGLLYLALGGAAVFIARDYDFGTAGRMGPGYFPSLIGGCLALIGAVSILRSIVVSSDPARQVAWRPLALITASVILFAAALPRIGLVPALVVLLLIATLARREAHFSLIGIAAAALLIAFCALVFVKGLGLAMPLFGPWLGG